MESAYSSVSDHMLQKYGKQLSIEQKVIISSFEKCYDTMYGFTYAPFDKKMITKVQKLAVEKRAYNPTIILIIGIGGSHLGAASVYEALCGSLYNDTNPDCKVYFVDSVDTDRVSVIKNVVEQQLQQGNIVLLQVVSKSGKTIETMANFSIFYQLIKKYKGEKTKDYIIVTTDKGSVLHSFALDCSCAYLEIPQNVGGRFSVFTPAGLFLLAFVGIDIMQLCKGAQDGFFASTKKDVIDNKAMQHASFLFHYYTQGFDIHNLFLFWQDGKKIGEWYRQLLGESIAKKHDKKGNVVSIGITPTVSIGTTDLHSVIQLYLAGKRNTVTTFITIEKKQYEIEVPTVMFDLHNIVGQKTVDEILHAVEQGVKKTYTQELRPYVSVVLPEKNAYFIGKLLQSMMIEICYLASLFGVNPFDQPQVALYKIKTEKLLQYE